MVRTSANTGSLDPAVLYKRAWLTFVFLPRTKREMTDRHILGTLMDEVRVEMIDHAAAFIGFCHELPGYAEWWTEHSHRWRQHLRTKQA